MPAAGIYSRTLPRDAMQAVFFWKENNFFNFRATELQLPMTVKPTANTKDKVHLSYPVRYFPLDFKFTIGDQESGMQVLCCLKGLVHRLLC